MLVCRYANGYGRVDHDHVVPVEYDPPTRRWVPQAGPARPLDDVVLLPPATPSKIVCAALNHGPSTGASLAVVLKPPSSLIGPGDRVRHPGAPWELRHEAELAVVIGVRCRNVPAESAADVVAGYTCANDVTAYAQLSTWAKHFDGLTPLGPWLATDLDPSDIEITCRVDGDLRQHGSTGELTRSVPEVVAEVSEHTTLMPNDVILTGTLAGSGPLVAGDRVEVSIAGIGTLRNTVGTAGGVNEKGHLRYADHP